MLPVQQPLLQQQHLLQSSNKSIESGSGPAFFSPSLEQLQSFHLIARHKFRLELAATGEFWHRLYVSKSLMVFGLLLHLQNL